MTEGRRNLNREIPTCGSVIGGKRNKCVIFPVKSSMVAESMDRSNKNWIVQTKPAYESDLIVRVGDFSFHLHKLPMVARSKYLNRMIIQNSSHEVQKNNSVSTIELDNLPGGAMAFELVMKFCYGWKVDLTAKNVAPLYCAAHFLEMTDDLTQGNLTSKAEAFMSFVISSSWNDTFKVLKSCESISRCANRLHIPKRCSEAIALKACMNPEAFCNNDYNVDNVKLEVVADNWWFADVSVLRIDHFIEVIESGKRRGMRSEVIGSCIAHWTMRWFSSAMNGLENSTLQHLTKLRSVTVESLIRILPFEENSVTSSFLLHILKLGSVMKIDSELLTILESRLAMMLEKCDTSDLLVKNYGEDDSVYDVAIVTRVVKSYAAHISDNSQSNLLVVGRLVDDYLMLVARDQNLRADCFQVLVEALPQNARVCFDNMYRAIDMYLKAHPELTEEERTCLCSSLKYHKLSQAAREHIMRNDRLPLKYTTSFILLEQVMTRPRAEFGMSNGQTKGRVVMGESRGGSSWMMSSQKEISMMKREVETMKGQLNDMQMCKTKLEGQVKKGFNYKKNFASVRKIVCLGFNSAKMNIGFASFST
ncbi:root phototropism protein 3-like isoform X1 [Cucurbita pepo subsp. pepo]|uniref:root phototropism protein 3-like isoform X1 n=2 Tax=Cucurbita pepo subsp. pepo TaxID=3664 RepID=UPI000C9D6239|nr:root phototropism protein 3-like isoform X1 [Cucurbita pepo subsp. pepo]